MVSSSSSPHGVEDQLPLSRRFFKFFMPGFHSKITLPPAFCLKFKEDKSKEGVLRSYMGTWNVQIRRSSELEVIFCGKGWRQFVKIHGLEIGEVAVFEYCGDMHFIVTMLESATGCGKEFRTKRKIQKPVEHQKGKKILPYHYQPGSSQFTARIKGYNIRGRSPFMHLPVKFCQSNALLLNTTVTLTGPSGESFPVGLRTCYGGKTVYVSLTSGWYTFYSSNNIKEGDVCIFELDRTKSKSIAMDVRIVQPVDSSCLNLDS